MRESFTETTRVALAGAQQAARELNQDFVGTEHLALGLLGTDGDAVRALRGAHVDPAEFKRSLAALLPAGTEDPVVTGDLPLSPKAQRVVNGALVKAQSMRESRVSTRFLLLSLTDELPPAVAKAMTEIGGDLDSLMVKLVEKPATAEA